MTLLQSIILGIIQGITEFLPISSSGHLVLVPNILGWDIPSDQAFSYNVLLQAATLLAVLSFFYHDFISIGVAVWQAIKQKSFAKTEARLGLYIVLTTIPAGLVGISLNGYFEQIFNNPTTTSFSLLGTAIFLIIAEQKGGRNRSIEDINLKDSLWIGFFQIFALFPGISRSGATIAGGMLQNLDRPTSARFSFLISFPLLIAAGLNGLVSFIALPNSTETLPIFLIGSIIAALVGFFSIKWLLNFLAQRSLYTFAIYCVLFAIINLAIVLCQAN